MTKRVQELSKRPTTFCHGGKSTWTRKLTLLTFKWGIRDDIRRRCECMFDMTWAPKARLVEIFTCLQEMKRGFYYVNQCMVAQWGSLVHRGMIFFPCVKSRFSTTQVSLNILRFFGVRGKFRADIKLQSLSKQIRTPKVLDYKRNQHVKILSLHPSSRRTMLSFRSKHPDSSSFMANGTQHWKGGPGIEVFLTFGGIRRSVPQQYWNWL